MICIQSAPSGHLMELGDTASNTKMGYAGSTAEEQKGVNAVVSRNLGESGSMTVRKLSS